MSRTKTRTAREYHVAVDRLLVDGETSALSTTYLGTVDQDHVDEVRAICGLEDSERHVMEHPRQEGAFFVLRDDGDLDRYVPTDAPEFEVRDPDPERRRHLDDFEDDQTEDGEDGPRGASRGPAYVAGVVRFGDQSIGGAMDHPESGPRFTWHTTESPGGKSYFYSIAAYLIRVGAEPHLIYDPETDLLGQFGPLNLSARALRNDGQRRTNREGRVNVQVEVLGRAKSPWTTGWTATKKPNFQRMIAAGRAWGVPDVWPAGKPAATASAAKRPRDVWQSKAGHYAHGQVPGNNHWDPGGIDTAKVPGKAVDDVPDTNGTGSSTDRYTVRPGDSLSRIARRHDTTVDRLLQLNPSIRDEDVIRVGQVLTVPKPKAEPAKPTYQPYPGREFFHAGRSSSIITAMGRRLVAEGCSRYASGPGPTWTRADERSYAAWQRKLGYVGSDADGIPGEASWDRLRVPHV